MNQPIHNDYWLSRFESILNSALVQHRAVSFEPPRESWRLNFLRKR